MSRRHVMSCKRKKRKLKNIDIGYICYNKIVKPGFHEIPKLNQLVGGLTKLNLNSATEIK